MRYTTGEIARITGARLSGPADIVISKIAFDSRRIDQAEGSVFVALAGPNHDGHDYLTEAHRLGIRAFLTGHPQVSSDSTDQSAILVHPNPLLALQKLAAHHRIGFKGKLVAVTGSNGKTQVKEWLFHLLQSYEAAVRSPGSYNSQLGVPLSVLRIEQDHRWAVIEAGISLPGEMARIEEMLKPDFGLITNIGDAHQKSFTTHLEKAIEKFSLFKGAKRVYFGKDLPWLKEAEQDLPAGVTRVTWSVSSEADLIVEKEEMQNGRWQIEASFRGRAVGLTVPFADRASVENLLLIWLFTLDQGFEPGWIQREVLLLEPLAMRLEQKAGIHGCTLINDYYNSDLQSLTVAIDLLFQQTPQQKKSIIISDILQSGVSPERLYSDVAALLNGRQLHRIIGIGKDIRKYAGLFSIPPSTFASTQDFLANLRRFDFHEEAILLKGARRFGFEQISRVLEERVHNTVLEISMNDLRHNLNQFRKKIRKGTRLMVMVKAFSYGSGGFEIARLMASERVDYLGVAIIDEGIELRQAGVTLPIMVMNPDLQQADLLVEHHLEPEIFSLTGLTTLIQYLGKQGIRRFPVHLKIDSGMHRLGFDPEHLSPLVDILCKSEELLVRSVFSHLAASEDPNGDQFSHEQISRFSQACEKLKKCLPAEFMRHILNSSGIMRFPEAQMDMVRLGIGLYGLGFTNELDMKPVTTMKTRILQIHHLKAGEHVGYGTLNILERPAVIAIVPVGYADGIDRRLGNGNWSMVVNGALARTIGNVCMDMTLLDITGIEAIEGDEVLVIGSGAPVSEMANRLGTIPYEILTSVPPRVKRVFLFE